MKSHAWLLAGLRLLGASAALWAATPVTDARMPRPGQIVIDPAHPQALKRHGGGPVFICGPGDPENFLYRGERNADGTRRGDQIDLIEKLARHGGNCIYLQAVRTHGGDAKADTTQNPFVDSDPAKGLDRRILDQWEQWFARMEQHGILIYFLFYDDSARIWNTGDEVGAAERQFFEAIVKRFQHHPNLIWIIGEETDERYSPRRVRALAEVIRATDDHGHIIGSHHLSGTTFRPWKPGSALSHFSMQLNLPPEGVHAGAIEARAKSADRYQVFYAENTATPKDDDSQRRHAWSVAMAGLTPMMLQMDIAGTSTELLAQCRVLQRFFEDTDYYRMVPRDELGAASTRYVLADEGRSYLAYAEAAGEIRLRTLPAARGLITWVDCRTGATVSEEFQLARAGEHSFTRPAAMGDECAAWIRFPAIPPRDRVAAASAAQSGEPAVANRTPQVADREVTTRAGTTVDVQLRFFDEDGPGPYTYTIVEPPKHGRLTGTDNDLTYTPSGDFTGTDAFLWTVSDGLATSARARITVRVQK